MKRVVRGPLYDEVLDLATQIAQPEVGMGSEIDREKADVALSKLVDLFHRHQDAGSSDPFLTETLADFTNDDDEAVRLYRLALSQSATFPGEPTHTKRQALVERLLACGRTSEALPELEQARREAFAAGDSEAVKELNALGDGDPDISPESGR